MSTGASRVFVWAWLPAKTEPVVVGSLSPFRKHCTGQDVLRFSYEQAYLNHRDAISLFEQELPLTARVLDPSVKTGGGRSTTLLAGCLRDAAPDAWGRAVIRALLQVDADTELSDSEVFLHSTSNRVGGLDFQTSADAYTPREKAASLDELAQVVGFIENDQQLPDELVAAALQCTGAGGARPKGILETDSGQFIAKFSAKDDARPVVQAEAVAMFLAGKVGVDVAKTTVETAGDKEVLLVERFDREPEGGRKLMVSGLTILGLRSEESRYASYTDLAAAIQAGSWHNPTETLTELYTRMVFNVAVSNTDDHLRNHAAFWDGNKLTLTPAYDLCPSPRNTSVATHAIALTADGNKYSQFDVAKTAAPSFGITDTDAQEIIDNVVAGIKTNWNDACDWAMLSAAQSKQLWEREFLNPYVFYPEN